MRYTARFARAGTLHYTASMRRRTPARRRRRVRRTRGSRSARPMTFTGLIGRICMLPLRLIISLCVALRIHPNILTFVGVLINIAAAWALALGTFATAGVIMVIANIFDFIDGKVALELKAVSAFGGFWDSVIDRFSDISLFIGLIYL